MKTALTTLYRGMLMGMVEVIPGVSSSTLALVLGIYDDFIELLSQVADFVKTIIKFILRRRTFDDVKTAFKNIDLKFGFFLILGMVLALGLFSHVITMLLEKYPEYIFSFFFGLVIASIAIPWKEMKTKGLKQIVILVTSFVVFFIVLGLKPLTVEDPHFLFLFISGALAICTMALPGVSGSFVFLLLGVYDYVIGLLRDFSKLSITLDKLIDTAAVALGIIVGFTIFIKYLKIGLKKYPSEIMAFLVGVMLASLRVLWPFINVNELTSDTNAMSLPRVLPWEIPLQQLLVSVFLIISAILVVNFLRKFSDKSNLKDLS